MGVMSNILYISKYFARIIILYTFSYNEKIKKSCNKIVNAIEKGKKKTYIIL